MHIFIKEVNFLSLSDQCFICQLVSISFGKYLVLLTMINFNMSEKPKLNDEQCFWNDKSVIYIKCFFLTYTLLFCYKLIKSAGF